MRRWLLGLLSILFFSAGAKAQSGYTQVSATVIDSSGAPYVNAPYNVSFYDPGTSGKLPLLNGSTFQQSFTGVNTDSFGNLAITLPDNGIIASSSGATGTQWIFSLSDQTNKCHAQVYLTITGATQNISSSLTSALPVLSTCQGGGPGTTTLKVNGSPVPNANLLNNSPISWSVAGPNITPIFTNPFQVNGGGSITFPNFVSTASVTVTQSGNNISLTALSSAFLGGVVPNPTFFNSNITFGGPNPYVDISSTPYNARAVTINTTGSGSGTSLTVVSSLFANGDGITVAGVGNLPAIATPTGLTVTPGFAGGETVPDAVMIAASAGSAIDAYRIFVCDIFDGCSAPTSTVSTSTSAASLGETQEALSTWSITGNTLTFATTSTNIFPVGTWVHTTGTSNAALAGGWYPISTSSSSGFTVNNVPQYSVATVSGTGGNATAMAGNTLTWTPSTGGTVGTLNMPWEYFVCVERPGDSSFHIIGRSFPSTFFAESNGGNFSTEFVDFGATISANPLIPWDISNANCTSGAAQREMFTSTVSTGGGTTGLALANSLPSSASGALVRRDDTPAIEAAAAVATSAGGSFYIPTSTAGFVINSPLFIPYTASLLQTGNLVANAPIMANGSFNWAGPNGITAAVPFGFNGAPQITCNAWPCVYVGGEANQATGGTTFSNLTFTSQQNGLEMLVDANWGMIWQRVNFVAGSNNNDNMGMGLVIRPGAASYTIRDSTFVGGPNQVIDQTWTPLLYLTRGHTGCCSGGGGVGTLIMDNVEWNRRGFYDVNNGGDGMHFSAIGRTYSQGGITPRFTAQNINGNITGLVEINNVFHDTESQATYAWICNVSCSGGSGFPFTLGFTNMLSVDGSTIPAQITGGGNQGTLIEVAGVGMGGTPTGGFGTQTGYGWTYYNGRLIPTVGLEIGNNQFGAFVDISPSVPTPELQLESGSFFGNLTATLTATRAWVMPDAAGTICLTTTCSPLFSGLTPGTIPVVTGTSPYLGNSSPALTISGTTLGFAGAGGFSVPNGPIVAGGHFTDTSIASTTECAHFVANVLLPSSGGDCSTGGTVLNSGAFGRGQPTVATSTALTVQTSAQSLDCTAYGVVGNGSTDDTAAMQAGASALGSSGGTLKLPAGLTVLMTTTGGLPITFSHVPVTVECAGTAGYGQATTIFETANAALLFRVGTINNGSAQQSGVLFKGCGFNDSSASHNTALGAILVTDTNNSGCENCAFENFNRPPITTPAAPTISAGSGSTSYWVQISCVNDAGGKTPASAEQTATLGSTTLTVTAPTATGCVAPSTGYLVLASTSATGTETLQASSGCTLNTSGTGCGLTNNWSGTVTVGALTEAAFKYDTSAGFGVLTDSQSGAGGTSQDASYGHWVYNTFQNMQEAFINNGGIQFMNGNHFSSAVVYNVLANRYQAGQVFAYGNEQEIANTTTARGVIFNGSSGSDWDGKWEGSVAANTNITCAEVNSSRNHLSGTWTKCGVRLIQENSGIGSNTYDIHQQVSNLASPLISTGFAMSDAVIGDNQNGGEGSQLPFVNPGVYAIGSTLPAATTVIPGALAEVTNGSTVSDCTAGGGSNRNVCMSNGTIWISVGNTTSGGTTTTIASGTAALGTATIASATCATTVTVTATGVATTDDIMADFNANPTSTVGYIPSASGMLTIIKWPTSGNVNFSVCNNTSASITPGAVTLNFRVVR